MRIRIAIIENDENYLKRFIDGMNLKYSDKLEIYTFSNVNAFLSFIKQNKVDITLVGEALVVECGRIPDTIDYIYLVGMSNVQEYEGRRAICKFQRIDFIYKEILSIFAETCSVHYKFKDGENSTKIYVFCSPKGGCGATTLGTAFSVTKALQGNKVFYLNLEQFGDPKVYFQTEGEAGLDEVIFSIKSKKSNLTVKIESAIKTDKSGVEYFDACKNAYDMLDVTNEDVDVLLRELSIVRDYDYIIIDMDFGIQGIFLKVASDHAEKIILVNDGKESGNGKLMKALEVFKIFETKKNMDLLSKCSVVYNQFNPIACKQIEGLDVPVEAVIGKFKNSVDVQIMNQIATSGDIGNI